MHYDMVNVNHCVWLKMFQHTIIELTQMRTCMCLQIFRLCRAACCVVSLSVTCTLFLACSIVISMTSRFVHYSVY